VRANMHLRVKAAQPNQAVETAKKPEGRFARFNSAVAKFVTFHKDEKLTEMGSPYKWIQ